MASGRDPWSEMRFENAFQALYHIGSSNSIPRIPDTLSEAGQEFTRWCLTRDPDQRPSAAQLLKHRWLAAGAGAGTNSQYRQESSQTEGLRAAISAGSGGAKTAVAQLEQLALMVDSKLATQPLHATLPLNPAAPVIHGAARANPAAAAVAAAPASAPGDDWIPPPPPPDAEGGPEDRRSAAAAAVSPFSHSGAASAILQPTPLSYSNGFNMQYFPPTASSVASHNSSGSRIHHYADPHPGQSFARAPELSFGSAPGSSADSDSSASMSACSSLNSSVVSFVEGWDGPLSPPPVAQAKH